MAMFVLNYWLREFLLAAFANGFELKCEPKAIDTIVWYALRVITDGLKGLLYSAVIPP